MIRNYRLEYPGEVVFGAGSIEKLTESLRPFNPILLVTGKSATTSGLLPRLEQLLTGHELITVCGVAAEPPLSEVNRGMTNRP